MNLLNYPQRAFVVLVVLGVAASFLSLPFPTPIPSLLIAIVVVAVIVGAGLWFAQNTALPFSLFANQNVNDPLQLLRRVGESLAVGAILGVVMIVALRYVFIPILPILQSRFAREISLPIWQRAVIAFDSAALEELLFRLFAISLLAWLSSKVWGDVNQNMLWAINILIALGFGAAHLPNWASITPLTPIVILSVIFLNSIGGLIFGFLYIKSGIEAAMLAHFAADLVLHIIALNFLKL